MKATIVLGAGATLADSIRLGSSDKPPLDQGFHSQAKTHEPDLFSLVDSYCRTEYGIDVTASTHDSLESILAILYADSFRSGAEGNQAFQAFRALIEILIRELARTSDSLRATRKNFVYQVVNRLLGDGLEASDITVVTFNYDLHIERSLQLLAKDGGQEEVFSFPSCYRIAYERCTKPNTGVSDCFDVTEDTKACLSILKLHGSLNWYSRHNSSTLSKSVLLNARKSVSITRRRKIDPFMMTRSGPRRYHSFPIIVPPVFSKASVLPEAMKPLWQLAETAIRESEIVIVMGYSCPPSDHESANMFRRAFRGNTEERQLHIVDPNPGILMRYVGLTDVTSISYYRSADTFVNRWVKRDE